MRGRTIKERWRYDEGKKIAAKFAEHISIRGNITVNGSTNFATVLKPAHEYLEKKVSSGEIIGFTTDPPKFGVIWIHLQLDENQTETYRIDISEETVVVE